SRAARLREAASDALIIHLDGKRGQTVEALVERGETARMPDFTPLHIVNGPLPVAGRPARFHITGHDNERLTGVPA
ncbi:MAG: tRNA (N(6)-L-threonylcarbamoyladenosine(37)-C(2))-methylthiotransferase MtaB, partial [Hyphomonadaceae bacterium]|nr:tRNA (N(6)-L-threonylcarbamoyladenosine(37)-C(2))-methylthiotransferase MtaB [Hyphomonadaceae bacterium]